MIDVGANSAPVVVDWNNDGLLDLLIGNETTSQGIRLYINSGTPTNPLITSWTYIQSGGSSINRYRCCPQVIDLNQDGKKDLVMGENDAKIYYYENVGTDEAPVFSGFEALQAGGSDIDLYYGSRLWVDDWNSDGYLDLLVSDYDGFVYKFPGSTTGAADFMFGQVEDGFGITPSVNPAFGAFSMNLQGAFGTVEVSVYDATGRKVAGTVATTDAISIGAAGLPAGVYSVIATDNGGSTSTCRVVLTD